MRRGFALAILLLASARGIAAQQPNSPTAAAISTQTWSQAPPTSAPAPSQTSCQPPVPSPQAPDAWHCVTVKFDYDFNKTPPCSTTRPVHPCVAQFAVYETTAGISKKRRVHLFDAPLPPNPKGIVTGVTQQSPKPIDFVLGWHKLCVAALDPGDGNSIMRWCRSCGTWIYVQTGPTPTASTPAPCSSPSPPPTPPTP